MPHYTFFAGNNFDESFLTEMDTYLERFPDNFSVFLEGDEEFFALLDLLGMKATKTTLAFGIVERYFDLSSSKFPLLKEAAFDDFYWQWLAATGRENTTDEYGQLGFIVGFGEKWNALLYRMVMVE